MANVTYLIGAGASAGKRDGAVILEGLPCVADIKRRVEMLTSAFQMATFPQNFDWKNAKASIIEGMQELKSICSNNATIDTYAKKLRLKSDYAGLAYIERLLTFYFVLEQILLLPDSRYDTFLASILEEGMTFPEHIKVISWNYDSQFEIAFNEYEQSFGLNVGSKINAKENQKYDIVKINGSARFNKMESLPIMREKLLKKIDASNADHKILESVKVQILLGDIVTLYKSFVFYRNPLRQNNTQLSFAFDDTNCNDAIYHSIDEIMGKTDVLVIIGYTFPFFNRETDRRILHYLKSNAKIYIQDLSTNIKNVRQSLEAVLTDEQRQAQIVEIERTEQFYLPPEL